MWAASRGHNKSVNWDVCGLTGTQDIQDPGRTVPDSKDKALANAEISDLEYLKSRMKADKFKEEDSSESNSTDEESSSESDDSDDDDDDESSSQDERWHSFVVKDFV